MQVLASRPVKYSIALAIAMQIHKKSRMEYNRMRKENGMQSTMLHKFRISQILQLAIP